MDRHNDIVQGVVTMVQRRHPIVKGARNGNLYILAAELNNRGVGFDDALQACLQFEDGSGNDPFTAAEIHQVVQSAYKRTQHGTKSWVPRGQYRAPGPRLPSPWTLPETDRAQIIAKLVADLEAQEAAMPEPPPSTPEPSPPPAAPLPDPEPEQPATPLPELAPPPPSAGIVTMVNELAHLHPYTLALELYVRTGVELSGQQVARLLADTPKNSEGGSAPNAYPLSPSWQSHAAMPQR